MKIKYKMFFIGFFLAFLLCVGAYSADFFFLLKKGLENGSFSLNNKTLSNINEKKIIILGGSGAGLGISAQLIESQTGMRTVNMSTAAAMGLKYILYYTSEYINDGDIVLLALEYEHYEYFSESPSKVLSKRILLTETDYFLSLPFSQKIKFLRCLDPIASLSKFLLNPSQVTHETPPASRYGDSSYADSTSLSEYDFSKVIYAPQLPGLSKPISDISESWKIIASFVNLARSKGGQVLVTWPNTLYRKEYEREAALNNVNMIMNFYNKLSVPILGTSRDFMYDYTYFYDSLYHMNDIGVRDRTNKLVKYLRKYI